MKKALLALVIFALSFSVSAEENIVSVSPKWKGSLETPPRSKVTAVFQLTNNTDESLTLHPELILPDHWKLLIRDTPLQLEAGQSAIKIISFFVPRETKAGNYELRYRTNDEVTEYTLGSAQFTVQVLPHYGIDLQLKKKPSYTLAGEYYDAVYLLSNLSNTPVEADLEIYSSYEFPYEIVDYPDHLVPLDLGETKEITVRVETTAEYSRVINHRITVDAECSLEEWQIVSKDLETASTAFSDVDVYPQRSQERVQYHTLPLEVTISHAERIGTTWSGDVGLEIATVGTLDEAGKHAIEVQFRKFLAFPYTAFFIPIDRYSLKYSSDYVELLLGDHQYNLDPLIGKTRFSRGVGVHGTYRWFGLGGFYHSIPGVDPAQRYVAGSFDFSFPESSMAGYPSYAARLHVGSQISENLVIGLHQQVQPLSGLNLEVEAATGSPLTGEFFWSGMFKGSFNHRWLETAASFLIAQPGYPQDFTDRYTLSVNNTLSFFTRTWNIYAAYNQEQRNLVKDETMDSAPLTWNLRIGTRYLWKRFETDLFLMWKLRSHVDKLAVPDFNELSNTIELSIIQPISLFEIQGYGSWEFLNNRYLAAQSVQHLYTAIVSFLPNLRSRYFLNFTTNVLTSGYLDDVLRFSLNMGLAYEFERAKWTLDFSNRYLLTNREYDGADLNINTSFTYQFNDIHGASATGKLNFPRKILESTPEFKFTLEYTARPGLPVSRRSNIGSVKGFVYDSGTGEPMKNVIVRIEDQVVLSNKKGKFSFPSLTPGEHFLQIDTSRTETSLIPNRKPPVMVEIGEKQTTRLEIGMIEGGAIEGTVTLYTVPKELQGLLGASQGDQAGKYNEEDLVADAGFSRVLVEIERDDEKRRLFSDSKGYFIFQNLRPGRWKVKAYDKYLPPEHYFNNNSFTLEVSSGATEAVEVKIFPKKKTITLLESSGVLVENGEITVEETAVPEEPSPSESTETEEEPHPEIPEAEDTLTLLDLDWGISPDEAERVLIDKNLNFLALEHISQLPSEWGAAAKQSESADIAGSAHVQYFSPGILFDYLLGNVTLSFYNPEFREDNLYLSKVEIQLSDVDSSGVILDSESIFQELITRFFSYWNIQLDDRNLKSVLDKGEYSTILDGINITYRRMPFTGRIIISYENRTVEERYKSR